MTRRNQPSDLVKYLVPVGSVITKQSDLATLYEFYAAHAAREHLIIDFSDDAEAFAANAERLVQAWEAITTDVIARVTTTLEKG